MDRTARFKNQKNVDPPVWVPTPATSITIGDSRLMHGGPVAMCIPEHEHAEVQVQTRFVRVAGESGLKPLSSSLYASGQPHRAAIEDNWEVVVIHLGPHTIARAADELFSHDRVEIKPFNFLRAPFLENLNQAIREEFRSPIEPGRLYLESIAHVVAGHILRHHASTGAPRSIKGILSDVQLAQIRRFIDERIANEFTVDDLAKSVKLGPHRFGERLRLTTGMSPWQYVQARRLELAQELLKHSRLPLAHIALNLGFCNQSHFANAFKRAFGITAKAYRNLR